MKQPTVQDVQLMGIRRPLKKLGYSSAETDRRVTDSPRVRLAPPTKPEIQPPRRFIDDDGKPLPVCNGQVLFL